MNTYRIIGSSSLVIIMSIGGTALAQRGPASTADAGEAQAMSAASATMQYWTAERMRAVVISLAIPQRGREGAGVCRAGAGGVCFRRAARWGKGSNRRGPQPWPNDSAQNACPCRADQV